MINNHMNKRPRKTNQEQIRYIYFQPNESNPLFSPPFFFFFSLSPPFSLHFPPPSPGGEATALAFISRGRKERVMMGRVKGWGKRWFGGLKKMKKGEGFEKARGTLYCRIRRVITLGGREGGGTPFAMRFELKP